MFKFLLIIFSLLCISASAQPVPMFPPQGASVYTHTALRWSKVTGANNYEYQISASINFNITEYDNTTSDTFSVNAATLIPNLTYYWRVRSGIDTLWGPYSSAFNFYVNPSAISPPMLLSPFNGETGVLSNPVLRWSSVPGRYQYAVVVASDINFNNVVYGRCIDTTFYEIPPDTLHLNTFYYWKVCTEDSLGFGPLSLGFSFKVRTTGVQSISEAVPSQYKLFNNYPNPFNPTTKIKFDLPKNSLVKINVFDISGKQVDELINLNLQAGSYETEFNGTNLSSGIYYYRIEANNFTETKKMILVK